MTPGQWVQVRVAYDAAPDTGNFSILINGNAVPVTGTDVKAAVAANQVTTIGGRYDGIIGILDDLKLWSGGASEQHLVADWEFNSVDYNADPPTTPDSSPRHNDAEVFGASLVPSSAPSAEPTQGNLVIDEAGRTLYCGLLDFFEPGDSPYLTNGSDGLVHLYFASRPGPDQDEVFSVAQYNTESARSVFEAGWTSTADDGAAAASVQTGTVQFTAARSGGFMNQAAIEIRPTDVAELCDIGIDDRHGRT
ncbi:MAG TPA: hypothetical protein VGM10_15195, partial [Actinocrinis sp.]